MGIERFNPDTVYDPPWNAYSQVVKGSGDTHIHVSGIVGWDRDRETVSSDMRDQTAKVLENISNALDAAGGDVSNLVRTRILTTDAEEYRNRCHELTLEWYGDHKPVQTLQEVPALAREDLKVELEVTALLDEG